MAFVSIMKNFEIKKNEAFLEKAEALTPQLIHTPLEPVRVISVEELPELTAIGGEETGGVRVTTVGDKSYFSTLHFGRGDEVILDFGNHMVGHLCFQAIPEGSHFDAPAYMKFTFAERAEELLQNSEDYDGWLSSSWIQEDYLHIDVLPARVELPRRYAFRYVKIRIIDTSPKYKIGFADMHGVCETSADFSRVEPVHFGDDLVDRIEWVSVKTLADCMQTIFEDGVKRDRRLWLGDLRLQAKANYLTFKNYDLVKRCLYMFAGSTFADGRMGACVFHEPEIEVDDTYLADYALFFICALWEYYEACGDLETAEELYPQAMEQLDLVVRDYVDGDDLFIDVGDAFKVFLDWGQGLNKQAGGHGVLLYTLQPAKALAALMKDEARLSAIEDLEQRLKRAAIEHLWDDNLGLFVSGKDRQVSWASQAWLVLAGVFDAETNRRILLRTIAADPFVEMVTPYMYHHFVEALIISGEKEKAYEMIKDYWGEMVKDGADTFGELYNPKNKNESPYGSVMVNSYCHAWSCTPTYLLRKYYL